MSKPVALIMSCGGLTGETAAQGYADAFVHIGWQPLVFTPKAKLFTKRVLDNHDVRMIWTTCKYGLRQLPVAEINARKIPVVAQALLFNARNETYGGTSECVDPSDPYILADIDYKMIYTHIEHGRLWDKYMHRWIEMELPLVFMPMAANIARAVPRSVRKTHDVAYVGNFAHKQDVLLKWLMPLLARIQYAKMNLRGDWVNNPLSRGWDTCRDIYATAKVSLNLHTTEQRELHATVNERTFTIPLCGGFQITDSPLASAYLYGDAVCATTPHAMISAVEHVIREEPQWNRAAARHVATHHTYFHRLAFVFENLGRFNEGQTCLQVADQFAERHMKHLEGLYNNG